LEDFAKFDLLTDEIMSFSSLGIRPGLRRVSRLLFILGSPEKKIRAIQVLGTNGKGSTAAAMEAILGASGLKTALYTSPHLISLQERLRIGGKYAAASDWSEAWKLVAGAVSGDAELNSDRPSFFEHFTALCFLMMSETSPDICLVEAGMGGRYDATSACDAIAVFVNPIGLDHMLYLGRTIEEIAGEKFAAVRNGKYAFYSGDNESLVPIFLKECETAGAAPILLDAEAQPEDIRCGLDGTVFSYAANGKNTGDLNEIKDLKTPLIGLHQAYNAARAITALRFLRRKFPELARIDADTVRQGLARTDWPGRMEVFRATDRPAVILDGAHNGHAAEALVGSLSALEEFGRKIKTGAIVLAVMSDKDIARILGFLKQLACPIFCTALHMERSVGYQDLSVMARDAGIAVAGAFETPKLALDAAYSAVDRDEAILCCGSLFLVGYLRKILKYETI
jgi:dihydrofolate synthase/folylpolyglutamate synthase